MLENTIVLVTVLGWTGAVAAGIALGVLIFRQRRRRGGGWMAAASVSVMAGMAMWLVGQLGTVVAIEVLLSMRGRGTSP